MVSIIRIGEPLICFQTSTYPHNEHKQKIRTGTPVCIREPRLLYQWALEGSLFEAPQRIPSLCRNCTGYMAWHGTRWIAQSDRLRDSGRQESEKTGRRQWTISWHQIRQEQLLLQQIQHTSVHEIRNLLSNLLVIGDIVFGKWRMRRKQYSSKPPIGYMG